MHQFSDQSLTDPISAVASAPSTPPLAPFYPPSDWLIAADQKLQEYSQRHERDKVRLERPGRLPIRTAGLLPRRNQECPCGSGRKFKKCHGAPKQPIQTQESDDAPSAI